MKATQKIRVEYQQVSPLNEKDRRLNEAFDFLFEEIACMFQEVVGGDERLSGNEKEKLMFDRMNNVL